MAAWIITPLTTDHDRSQFACGQPSLDRFLKESARQNQDKDFSRTFVLTRQSEMKAFGYYTLAAGENDRASLPPAVSKKLPKYPVPVVVLGRLAVDESLKGKGLGKLLLSDALRRCLVVADSVGVFAVVVHAIDQSAADFYAKAADFIPLQDTPLKLYLPMATIRTALGG